MWFLQAPQKHVFFAPGGSAFSRPSAFMGRNIPAKWVPGPQKLAWAWANLEQGHFLEKQEIKVPTSPGWIWPKNMGLGKLGVINSQKRLPFGLKIEADILTRSR